MKRNETVMQFLKYSWPLASVLFVSLVGCSQSDEPFKISECRIVGNQLVVTVQNRSPKSIEVVGLALEGEDGKGNQVPGTAHRINDVSLMSGAQVKLSLGKVKDIFDDSTVKQVTCLPDSASFRDGATWHGTARWSWP